MLTEKELSINNFHCYRAGPVTVQYTDHKWPTAIVAALDAATNVTFDHVLNVPASEEVWPGDAKELFFQDVFMVRLVDDSSVYRKLGYVADHIRGEILRLCDHPSCISLEQTWQVHHMFSCYLLSGSFARELFGQDSTLLRPHETDWDAEPLSNDDDRDEPDSLNSELLLTEVYLPPASSNGGGALDSVGSSKFTTPSISPSCRAETNQPTEQKE